MGLLLAGPFSFAQESISQPVETQPASQAMPSDSDSQDIQNEVHDTKKLDKVLQDYNKDTQKVQQDAEVIKAMQDTGELSEEELDKGQLADPELEKSYKQAQNILGDAMGKVHKGKKQDLKGIKYSEAIKTTLKPLQKLSEDELLTMLKENTKGTAAGEYVERFPQLMVFTVRLIKDREAIPSFVSVMDDQDRLIRFSGLMIATILVGFFLKRFMKREGRSVAAALGVWFLRSLIMFSLRLGIIIFFFGEELTPAFNVALRTFF